MYVRAKHEEAMQGDGQNFLWFNSRHFFFQLFEKGKTGRIELQEKEEVNGVNEW